MKELAIPQFTAKELDQEVLKQQADCQSNVNAVDYLLPLSVQRSCIGQGLLSLVPCASPHTQSTKNVVYFRSQDFKFHVDKIDQQLKELQSGYDSITDVNMNLFK